MKLNNIKNKTLIHGDLGVWAVFLILCAISLIEVYSASSRMTFASGAYWDPIMQHGSFMRLTKKEYKRLLKWSAKQQNKK